MNLVARTYRSLWVSVVLILVPAILLAIDLVQKNPPVRSADADAAVAIWDIDLNFADQPPRNFRTTDDSLKLSKGEIPVTIGLRDLRASGSGEFTPQGLKLVLARTRGPVTVFDLRQETHIFVNALPVSWYASRDWANVGRALTAIEADEAARVESLNPGSKIDVRPGELVKKGDENSVPPESVTGPAREHGAERRERSQRQICANHRYRPCASALTGQVDRFILAVRELSENSWAHFHCEAGRGRTTTFMVLYDMLRNATRVSLEDIVRRQSILGYNYDVLQPPESGDWESA